MGQHGRRESFPGFPSTSSSLLDPQPSNQSYHHHHRHRYNYDQGDDDLVWPFGKLEGLDSDDVRETAYEIFFTSCRSSPGFGGRNALAFYSSHDNENGGTKSDNMVMSPTTSRVKRALGLKMMKRLPSKRLSSGGSSGGCSSPSSPVAYINGGGSPLRMSVPLSLPRPRRPMTSAEIMRQQMQVTEQSDIQLRKTLMRSLVGQVGRRAETIILPLELLRHLKPSEFSDSHEYHLWQKRQLKILEVGLLMYPLIPLEKTNPFAMRLREIIRSGESKPLDTGKNSDTMRSLTNSVVSLSWRTFNGTPSDVCHWSDGYPFNIHLYICLLQAIFDVRDETLVLDEVDELLELMKKTWSTLGIDKPIHNVCFTWVLFQQYVVTGQLEPDLLCATQAMLAEVVSDAKIEGDSFYVKSLSCVLNSMQQWIEKRLLNYHEHFQRGNLSQIENLLPLVLSASKILGDVAISYGEGRTNGELSIVDLSKDRVDPYIRSSIKKTFEKIIEAARARYAESQQKDLSEVLLHFAQEAESLIMKEREIYSPVLKRWHPTSSAVAALTLHSCYGTAMRQYLKHVSSLTSETVDVLHRAAKLEKFLVQIVVEDSVECEDGGKTVVREMVPYEVDSIILNLVRKWIDGKLKEGRECLQRAKETETWNPKSKSEPIALSVVELMKIAKTTVEEFFEIPIGITEDLVQELAEGLQNVFHEYMTFVASCGPKQSYVPSLPPLTRCNRDSKFVKLWKIAAPCGIVEEQQIIGINDGDHHRPSTSRGTQRLYIRLNTLHYLLTQIHSLDKSLSLTPGVVPLDRSAQRTTQSSTSYFEMMNSSIPSACQIVSEVAAFRLIFLDSNSFFYDRLYVSDVANARIRPALQILKKNLNLMISIVNDRAQALAMKEIIKACFDAFLMVLLAGGSSRVFNRSDHQMIQEDFESLKKVFCSVGEGLVAEEVVENEAEVVEGVITLMGQSTEQLMEDFSILTCEKSGIGVMGNGQKLPMPPTTGRWNRTDPNTILRVLCYRNDRSANQFLKRTFQLAKRR